MAKGKGSGKYATSKGERKSSVKTAVKDPAQRMLNQIRALKKGKNVVWDMPVLDKEGKIVSYTKVKQNGKEYVNAIKNFQRGMKEVEA